MSSEDAALRVSAWRALLDGADACQRLGLDQMYSGNAALCEERRQRWIAVLARYHAAFGDTLVRLFRAPGRINLRGMHVDTHGGWLNLMTHQRETLVVAGRSPDESTHVVNTDANYAPLEIHPDSFPTPKPEQRWSDFLATPAAQAHIARCPGHWRHYLEGAWCRARYAVPEAPVDGLCLAIDSNIPQGAALSSSAALCIALLQAWFGWHDSAPPTDARILAAQDAEWYTGSRCGTCDQAAIVLGQPNAIVRVALFPGKFSTAEARIVPFPADLRVLVINSGTRRSISGAEKLAYTQNRFAYSMAMEIFQQALRESGYPENTVAQCDRLSRITPDLFGGTAELYRVLKRVPECLPLTVLRQRYDLPDFDTEYGRYFGDLPHTLQPTAIGLRGPLLYGIAESERARHFAPELEAGNYARAGELMTIGHAGDRRMDASGNAVHPRMDDPWLDQCIADKTPMEQCPGAYGASSPALDTLVDTALAHGALGASLTGAGIAGTVLALCRAADVGDIAAGVRTMMARDTYPGIAGLAAPLSDIQLADAVVENIACTGAGEIVVN